MSKLLESNDWAGVFFLPDQYNNRFGGRLSYTAEHGVLLDYTIVGYEVPEESPTLWGVLDNGHVCTLIGRFNPVHPGLDLHNGWVARRGKAGFQFLLVGDFVSADKKYHKATFTLTNLQEFFFHKGHKDFVKYIEAPLLGLKTAYGEIEIRNSASFGFASSDIRSHLYNHNKHALDELAKVFNEIQDKYPKDIFYIKKNIEYIVNINITNGASIQDIIEYVFQIAELLALLIYNPVYPERIDVITNDDQNHPHVIKVYPSLVLEQRTVKLATEDKLHFQLPITHRNIELHTALAKWLQIYEDYSTITTGIQHETRFRNIHTVLGEITLYAAMLESISNNRRSNKNKYEYAINKYAGGRVKEGLVSIFNKTGIRTIGKNISTLRNEIVHIGKPRVIMPQLSLSDLVKIGQYMQLINVAYILEQIGISKQIIENYQKTYSPPE